MNRIKISFEKISKWISLIANIVTIIGVILGATYITQIANSINASFTNNVNVNTDSKTMEEELYEAQKYVEQGMYESAMKTYQKWKNSSSDANVNIGYLYSNGLGVDQNIEIASTYYKNAYNMGNKTGFVNYMFINLAKPTSYKQTITALRFGYEQNDEQTIKFLSLLMTDKLESKYSDGLKDNAKNFWDLTEDEQIKKMLNYTIENVEYIEQLKDDEMPSDTDFTTYMLTTINGNEYLYESIAGYVEVYDNVTDEYNWKPVYDVKNYYTKHSKHFIYADLLFNEKMITS